jgi:tol-pal system protein YbgF
MTTLLRLISMAGILVLLTGCVMPDKVDDMQKNLADIQAELQKVQRGQSDTLDRLQALESQNSNDSEQVTKADLADVTVGISQISRDVAIVDERINDMGRRFDRLSQQVQQAREMNRSGMYGAPIPAGGPADDSAGGPNAVTTGAVAGAVAGGAAASPGAVPDPEELYNTAYADFSKGNYALAISGFEEYHEKFAGSALADNATYWVGECHFSQGNFADAVQAFDRLLELYPSSDKAPASNLKKGLAYLEQNQVGKAIVQLRFVVSEYPGSDEAKIARDKLTSLGAQP